MGDLCYHIFIIWVYFVTKYHVIKQKNINIAILYVIICDHIFIIWLYFVTKYHVINKNKSRKTIIYAFLTIHKFDKLNCETQ